MQGTSTPVLVQNTSTPVLEYWLLVSVHSMHTYKFFCEALLFAWLTVLGGRLTCWWDNKKNGQCLYNRSNSQVNFLSKSHTAYNRRHPSEEVVPPTLFHHCTMKVLVLLVAPALAFVPTSRNPTLTNRVRLNADATTTELEPKEVVKLFGRLAEKYIMLDDSGGMCCYSGCSGEKP